MGRPPEIDQQISELLLKNAGAGPADHVENILNELGICDFRTLSNFSRLTPAEFTRLILGKVSHGLKKRC